MLTKIPQSMLTDPMLTPESYGAKGDKVTDDTVAIGKWLTAAAGSPCMVTTGKLYRITKSLAELYSGEIRVVGAQNCFSPKKFTLSPGQWFGGFYLDGANVSIAGYWDTITNTFTFPERVKMLTNMVVCTDTARYGLVEHLTNAVVQGVHFQGFKDHGLITVGAVFLKLHDISFYDCGLSKGVSGQFYGGTFMNGCGWLGTGYAPSGELGNAVKCRNWALGNYSSTISVDNMYVDTVRTHTSSCKGIILLNMRSTSLKNVGTYSGVYHEHCELSFDSLHAETYANGGDVDGNGYPQSLVSFDSRMTSVNGHLVYPALILRSPYTAGTDWWGYDMGTGNKREVGRMGFSELVLGTSQDDNPDNPPVRNAAVGSVAHPMVYWDKGVNALRVTKGNSFQVLLGVPIITPGTVSNKSFIDLDLNTIMPAVNLGSGPGGVYSIDIQITDPNTGAVFYIGGFRGLRQIAATPAKFAARYFPVFKGDNNTPAGGFTVSEIDTGTAYVLRIRNDTTFNYTYTVTSILMSGIIPTAV